MKQFNSYFLGIISAIAIVLSIISISLTAPRSVNLSIDYLGIIVGIMGICVAILLAWQLYNALNLKNSADIATKAMRDAKAAHEKVVKRAAKLDKDISDLQKKNDENKNLMDSLQNKNNDMQNKIQKRIMQYEKQLDEYEILISNMNDKFLEIKKELEEKIEQHRIEAISIEEIDAMFDNNN